MSNYAQLALSILREIPFIKDSEVKDKALKEFLSDPYKQNRIVGVPAGSAVIEEGEFGDTFYVILKGQLSVRVFNDAGQLVEVAQLQAGSFFGELAMIGKGRRGATIVSVTDCELLEISKGAFDNFFKKQKKVKVALQALYDRRQIEKFVRENVFLNDVHVQDKKLIVEHGKLVTLEPMKDAYKIGDAPASFYFVRQGFLKVWRMDGDAEAILAFMRDADFFGDLELISGQPRTTSVTAMERVELIEVPRSVFVNMKSTDKRDCNRAPTTPA